MKISIITVCFNSANTLVDTLLAVSSQTHDDVEHIVIDGGSVDGTQELVKLYGHRVTKFLSEPDEGIYDAMNKGISIATGDVIGVLNADDVYAHENVLKGVAKKIDTENLDVLIGDVDFFKPENPNKTIRRYYSNQFTPRKIGLGWMPAHPAMFVRRKVYDVYGLYKTNYKIAADYEFVARIFRSNRLKYQHVPEVLVRMRLGGVSTKGLKNSILLNKEVLRACRENGINTNIVMILSKYPKKILGLFFK